MEQGILEQQSVEVPPPVQEFRLGQKVRFFLDGKTHQGKIDRVVYPANGEPDKNDYPDLFTGGRKYKPQYLTYTYVVREHNPSDPEYKESDPKHFYPPVGVLSGIEEFEEIKEMEITKFTLGDRVRYATYGNVNTGDIVKVINPGCVPDRTEFPELYAETPMRQSRLHESYVILRDAKMGLKGKPLKRHPDWPHVKHLEPIGQAAEQSSTPAVDEVVKTLVDMSEPKTVTVQPEVAKASIEIEPRPVEVTTLEMVELKNIQVPLAAIIKVVERHGVLVSREKQLVKSVLEGIIGDAITVPDDHVDLVYNKALKKLSK